MIPLRVPSPPLARTETPAASFPLPHSAPGPHLHNSTVVFPPLPLAAPPPDSHVPRDLVRSRDPTPLATAPPKNSPPAAESLLAPPESRRKSSPAIATATILRPATIRLPS